MQRVANGFRKLNTNNFDMCRNGMVCHLIKAICLQRQQMKLRIGDTLKYHKMM